MIRKSEYYEQTDKFLSSEMTLTEIQEYEARLGIDSELAEELELQIEVEQALNEKDVISLRMALSQLVHEVAAPAEKEISVYDSFSFGLSEEFSSRSKLGSPVNPEDIFNFGHTFPQIHLYQHSIAGRENIHQFYREQKEIESSGEEAAFTAFEEELFNEVAQALEERDVFDLRANLGQISQMVPAHSYTTEEIEDYVYGRMELPAVTAFEEELAVNAGLAEDLRLVSEVDLAGMEKDIMDLRASLMSIQSVSDSGMVSIENIERYLDGDLTESEQVSFEHEISVSSSLMEEIALVRDIDNALMEQDVMQLRGNLQGISERASSEDRTERSLGGRIRINRRFIIPVVAASFVLLLGISGLLSREAGSEEIYNRYYSRYETAGIVRSSGQDADQTLVAAMQELDKQDYHAALSLFNQVLDRDASNMAGHFYAGISYQETGKYSNAVTEYETVIRNADNLFIEQAEWYAGLCYLQTGDTRRAVRQFRRIAQSDGYYQPMAKDILRKLKNTERVQ